MKNLITFFLLLSSITSFAQSQFEGEITYIKTSYSDTLYYVYSIKDSCVRIDEYDKFNRPSRAYIVNLQDESIMVINPNKQLYAKMESLPQIEQSQNLEVISTGNYKYINGYKCRQWRVRNIATNNEITYWMTGDNFNFYTPMSQIAMSVEDYFLFFKALPIAKMKGSMPMLIENKTLTRAPKATISVTSVKQHSIDTSIFNLSQYQKFENLR